MDGTCSTQGMMELFQFKKFPKVTCWISRVCDGCCEARRPQWPRCLRHELSSPTRMLWSSVQIPLKAWMFMGVHSVFTLLCV
jgi:hypothetical protein